MGRLLPIRKPTPLAADDVHQRVSHGTKAAAQIARELLGAERGNRLQNPVVRPAVVFVEQLNVIFSHGGGWLTLSSGKSYLAPGVRQNRRCGHFCHAGDSRRTQKSTSEPSNFQIADHSSRLGGFAEHQGSTTLTLRGHPTRPSRSARLSRWGSNPCSRALPERWTSSLIAWRRPEFSKHMPGSLHAAAVRIWTKRPTIAQWEA